MGYDHNAATIVRESIEYRAPPLSCQSTVYLSENLVDVTTTANRTSRISCYRRLSANTYLNTSTGEVSAYSHKPPGPMDASQFKRAFDQLRRTIYANISGNGTEKHIVLTLSSDNPSELEDVYTYFGSFWKKLKYRYPGFRYIAVAEPNSTGGRYHLHLLLICDIPVQLDKDEICRLWGKGYVYIAPITSTDRIAAYFYVKDKRARWAAFYHPRKRLFRCSRGIIRPKASIMTREEVNTYVQQRNLRLSSASCHRICQKSADGSERVLNVITYEQFSHQ